MQPSSSPFAFNFLLLAENKNRAGFTQCGFAVSNGNALFLSSFDNRLTPVCATFLADPVGDMVFTAVLAYHKVIQRQRIVRTALIAASAGVSTFW